LAPWRLQVSRCSRPGVFLLGIADFGRVFADGIALEAAARNSAEAAAEEYLQLCQTDLNLDPSACSKGLQPADYATLHDLALEVGCRESDRLTNVQKSGPNCTNPLIAVCIHDDPQGDATRCGQEAPSPGGPCYAMDASWTSARLGPAGGRPYAEVRMCYRFDPLVTFSLGGWASVWLQKSNTFAVTNY
jgi:hypothetical protein